MTPDEIRTRLQSLSPRRILLVHPTKYLGNLLISGYLIQAYAAWCRQHKLELALVLDKQYEQVFAEQFADVQQIFWYPRKQLSSSSWFVRTYAYLCFLRRIRRFRADIAFNLEEDSVAATLVRLSGARFRLGSTALRGNRGYDAILPVEIKNRDENERHRWYSYREVFCLWPDFLADLEKTPVYLKINNINSRIGCISDVLDEIGGRPFIVLHPGGTKHYKRWPVERFAELAQKLAEQGKLPVFIGAGKTDTASVERILALLRSSNAEPDCLNLCNRLDLNGLMALFSRASAMVGNDSGPFHLGSASGLPGVVLFGPTETDIWGPLGQNSRFINKKHLCHTECTRHDCKMNYQCLSATTAEEVCDLIDKLQKDKRDT